MIRLLLSWGTIALLSPLHNVIMILLEQTMPHMEERNPWSSEHYTTGSPSKYKYCKISHRLNAIAKNV